MGGQPKAFIILSIVYAFLSVMRETMASSHMALSWSVTRRMLAGTAELVGRATRSGTWSP